MPSLSTLLSLLVMASVIPTTWAASKRNKAQGEVNMIAMAVKSYDSDYGRMPMGGTMPDNAQLMDVLSGNDPEKNRRNTVYLELESDEPGQIFKDPWGEAYRIHLDHDYDTKIHLYGESWHSIAIAQSAGWDREFGTVDDLFSWGAKPMNLAPRSPEKLRMRKRQERWNDITPFVIHLGLPILAGLFAYPILRKERTRKKRIAICMLIAAITFVIVGILMPPILGTI